MASMPKDDRRAKGSDGHGGFSGGTLAGDIAHRAEKWEPVFRESDAAGQEPRAPCVRQSARGSRRHCRLEKALTAGIRGGRPDPRAGGTASRTHQPIDKKAGGPEVEPPDGSGR